MQPPFSPGVLLTFEHARDAAASLGLTEISTGILLVGLVRAGHWFDSVPIDADRIVERLSSRIDDPSTSSSEMPFSPEAKKAIEVAFRAGAKPGVELNVVGVEGAPMGTLGLVMGLLADRTNDACSVLSDLGIDLDALEKLAKKELRDHHGS